MRKNLKHMVIIMALGVATVGLHINTNSVEVEATSKVTYTLENGVLTVKGKGEMPKSMTFKNNKKIKKVVIEKGVTSISKKAFEGCKKLKEVKIANTVKHISKKAFAKTGIENIIIPKSVDTMGVNVFDSCNKLKNITMPGDVKVKQYKKFYCTLNPGTKVDTVKFTTELELENITYLYANNFDVHKNDKNYKDIDGVIYTKDGKEIVRVPSGREKLVVDEKCEVFCTNAIYYSYVWEDSDPHGLCNVSKVVLPANVKEINDEKHYRIGSAGAYTSYIGEWVIENKDIVGLDKLTKEIHELGGWSLKDTYCKFFPDFVTVKDGMYFIEDNVMIGYVNDENIEKNVVIPEGVKEIRGEIFGLQKYNVESVTLPEGLEVIGDGAFNDTNIKEIKIPSTVKEIGFSFAYCENLAKVELNKGLEKIGTSFYWCRSLKKIEIPKTVKIIDVNAFNYSSIEKIVIPDSVQEIGESAFSNLPLTDIVIGKNVKYIGKNAFANTQWKKLVVPVSVEKIDEGAFSECSYATEIVIENENAEINERAFENSNNLNVVSNCSPKKYVTNLSNTNTKYKKKYRYETYTWNTYNNILSYQVVIADDEAFTENVVKKKVKTNGWKFKVKNNEKKYIRVRPILIKGGKRVFGAWSNVC